MVSAVLPVLAFVALQLSPALAQYRKGKMKIHPFNINFYSTLTYNPISPNIVTLHQYLMHTRIHLFSLHLLTFPHCYC